MFHHIHCVLPFRSAVSPFRQRPTKEIFQGWMFNGYRRLASQAPYWIVPFAIGAFLRVSTSFAPDYTSLRHIHLGEALRCLAKQQGWTHCTAGCSLIL